MLDDDAEGGGGRGGKGGKGLNIKTTQQAKVHFQHHFPHFMQRSKTRPQQQPKKKTTESQAMP